MRRYRKIRYYKRSRPAYTVNRKLIQAGNWTQLRKDGWYSSATEVLGNPSVLTSNSPGSVLTVKHLQVQLLNLPNFHGTDGTDIRIGGQPAGGWLLVYVPEGSSPNLPFPDLDTGLKNFTLYEPNQFVLGHGTWLPGQQYRQSNLTNTVINSGNVEVVTTADNTPGNNMRIRCPLSKKLNPGDRIFLIFYTYNFYGQPLTDVSMDAVQAVVSYASKVN